MEGEGGDEERSVEVEGNNGKCKKVRGRRRIYKISGGVVRGRKGWENEIKGSLRYNRREGTTKRGRKDKKRKTKLRECAPLWGREKKEKRM